MLQTALDAGVSPETLRKIETGRVATPAFSTIAAIADVLGLSLDTVWDKINQPERSGEPANPAAYVRKTVTAPSSAHSCAIHLDGVDTVPTPRPVSSRRP